jgi:hypothetical protein
MNMMIMNKKGIYVSALSKKSDAISPPMKVD